MLHTYDQSIEKWIGLWHITERTSFKRKYSFNGNMILVPCISTVIFMIIILFVMFEGNWDLTVTCIFTSCYYIIIVRYYRLFKLLLLYYYNLLTRKILLRYVWDMTIASILLVVIVLLHIINLFLLYYYSLRSKGNWDVTVTGIFTSYYIITVRY